MNNNFSRHFEKLVHLRDNTFSRHFEKPAYHGELCVSQGTLRNPCALGTPLSQVTLRNSLPSPKEAEERLDQAKQWGFSVFKEALEKFCDDGGFIFIYY